jgi:hypothetical protein
MELEPGPKDELRVGQALVHGSPAEVQEAAARLPKARALLLESFSWAVAGERQLALSLWEKIPDRDSVSEHEQALLQAALTGKPAPDPSDSGLVCKAMEMSLLAREAKGALADRRYPEAARAYSQLLLHEVGAPWPANSNALSDWTRGLDEAQREHRWNPRSAWPAVEMKVESGDSLIAIRMRYLSGTDGSALMCTGLIERANRVKGYLQPGQTLRIPTEPVRVQVDLSARWALYLLGDEVAAAWPVCIGRPGEDTPPGEYEVRNKLENPPWMKEGQEPIPFGDPRNPLGTRWIGWSQAGAKTSYGFHGTWEPDSIGRAESDGCIRLLNQHVEQLFQILPEGAPVRIDA